MPNYIKHSLTLSGDENEVNEVIKLLITDDGGVTFENIHPMPSELKNTPSPCRIISEEEYILQEERIKISPDKYFSGGITESMRLNLLVNYGVDNWYDWSIENWGTKWDALEGEIDLETKEIKFETAWSTPFNFILNVSKKFPTVTFSVEFADEDFGYNVGKYTLLNGKEIELNILDGGSYEAYKLAVKLHGGADSWIFGNDYINDIDIKDWEDIINEVRENSSSPESTTLKLMLDYEIVNEKYPKILNDFLLEMAVESENYLYASKLRDMLEIKI